MSAMASQITSLTLIYSIVYSGTDKKTSKLRVTGLCVGNSPVAGEIPAQRASYAENVSIWWRHHGNYRLALSQRYILALLFVTYDSNTHNYNVNIHVQTLYGQFTVDLNV